MFIYTGDMKVPRDLAFSLTSGVLLVAGWLSGGTASLILFALAYIFGGYDLVRSAVRNTARGKLDIHVLMLLAAIGAAILGEYLEGALLLFLFSLGHALEHLSLDKARDTIAALVRLTPDHAVKQVAERTEVVPVATLAIGDHVLVRAGERLPVDGTVHSGSSSVDQAPITGESVPVAVGPGSSVFAGTVNGAGTLTVQVAARGSESTLARMAQLVAVAQKNKAPTERFAERFTRIFVPLALLAAAAVMFVPPLFGTPLAESFRRGLIMLVALSPCALAIATPAAVLSGIARAGRSGILVKGGIHLEQTSAIGTMVFDKTGTLTEGTPTVTHIATHGVSEHEALEIASALEAQSTHPLAHAILARAKHINISVPLAAEVHELSGRGLAGMVHNAEALLGNQRLLTEHHVPFNQELTATASELAETGHTVVHVAHGGAHLAVLGLRDEPRPGAKEALARLRANEGVDVMLLSGDTAQTAAAIGAELGIASVRGEALPAEKLQVIEQLKAPGALVAMVGDGVNDAPALAAADVAFAMGSAGNAAALESADVVLLGDNLARLPYFFGLSRRVRRTIITNFAIAMGVIAFLVVGALTERIGITLAVILHEGSTLVVVLNSLRLLGFSPERYAKQQRQPVQ